MARYSRYHHRLQHLEARCHVADDLEIIDPVDPAFVEALLASMSDEHRELLLKTAEEARVQDEEELYCRRRRVPGPGFWSGHDTFGGQLLMMATVRIINRNQPRESGTMTPREVESWLKMMSGKC